MKSQLEGDRNVVFTAYVWTDKVSNEEVLQRANTSTNLLKIIVNRQIRFVWHIMRKSQLEAIALTGMIEGKRATGRQRKTFTDWLSFACGEQWKINDILKICHVMNVMSIYWSPTSESDMAHWIGRWHGVSDGDEHASVFSSSVSPVENLWLGSTL